MIITKDVVLNEKGNRDSQIRRLDANMTKLFLLSQGRNRFGDGSDAEFGENISGQFQVYTSNATPDTEDTISHDIGSTPIGYIILKQNKAGSLYTGTTSWSSSNVYLKCSIASVTFTIFLIK